MTVENSGTAALTSNRDKNVGRVAGVLAFTGCGGAPLSMADPPASPQGSYPVMPSDASGPFPVTRVANW